MLNLKAVVFCAQQTFDRCATEFLIHKNKFIFVKNVVPCCFEYNGQKEMMNSVGPIRWYKGNTLRSKNQEGYQASAKRALVWELLRTFSGWQNFTQVQQSCGGAKDRL